MSVCIAVDAMSGDFGPAEIIPATLQALDAHSNLQIILLGQREKLENILLSYNALQHSRLQIEHAPHVISMDEKVRDALRNKQETSMRSAINLLNKKKVDACLSAGNTAVLMALSKTILGMLPDIKRPAICAAIPVMEGYTYILDVGANVDADDLQLLQFAVMGSALASTIHGTESPAVGLLNIGSEEIKGPVSVQLASATLENSDLNYIGFAEGTDIFTGKFDIIVCDGFIGNITLKTTEATANFVIKHILKEVFTESMYGKIMALFCKPLFRKLHKKIDPRSFNGASFLGLREIVIKSHGNADRIAFLAAINNTISSVEHNINNKILDNLEKTMGKLN